MTMNEEKRLFDKLADELVKQPNVERGLMFGMPIVKVNGNAFMGFNKGNATFKLNGKPHADALRVNGAVLSDPSGRGRPMKEWVEIPPDESTQWEKYAQLAMTYVATLPAK
jgi:hypothetical protein